jgi:hypothetical protein
LDGFLAIEKFILKHRGIFKNEVRRSPYSWDLDLETSSEILRLLQILDKAISLEQS